MAPANQVDDPRVPLAAERTLLAWVRTSLAMMGFGFVVARFGLFLRELTSVSNGTHPVPTGGMSIWIGIAMVVLGATSAVLAVRQHLRFLDRLARGEPYTPSRWSLGVLSAIFIALIGGVMGAYLTFMQVSR